jgi:hypothetical protein
MGNALTTLQNNTGGFVANNAVSLEHQRPDAPGFPEMNIRATDPGGFDVHQSLSFPWCVNWRLLEFQVMVWCHLEGRIGERGQDDGAIVGPRFGYDMLAIDLVCMNGGSHGCECERDDSADRPPFKVHLAVCSAC